MGYVVYVNGDWVSDSKASVSVSDVGLQRGYGVSEVISVYNGVPYLLDRHMKRMVHSLQALRIPNVSAEKIQKIIHAGIKKNGETDCTVKVIITGGTAAQGPSFKGRPTVIVLFSDPEKILKRQYTDGVRVIPFEASRMFKDVKSLNYISSVLGVLHAEDKDAYEAIFMDARGRVTEGMTSNFFIVHNGILYTVRTDHVLAGITRGRVLELARSILPVQEIDMLTERDVVRADEAFITSRNRNIIPVTQWDKKTIGDGTPGTWTILLMEKLSKDIDRACGRGS